MKRFMIVDAISYAFSFFKAHVWALMSMALVFMAISIGLGLIVAGSSLLLLQALSNNIWLMVALESPLLAAVGYIVFGIWGVSFITYLLALERTGSASVVEHLKNSLSSRVLKVIAFDLLVVLFVGINVAILASVGAGAWWLGGMQLAPWQRLSLGIAGIFALIGLVYLYVRLFFTKIVIADTNADIFAALAASWAATRGWFWRIWVMFFVIGLVGGIVSIAMVQLSGLIITLSGDVLAARLVGNVVRVLGALFNMVFLPITVLYYYNYLKVAKTLPENR